MVSAAQKIRNREGMEALLRHLNTHRNTKFMMGTDYELKSPDPEAGKRYLTLRCGHCAKTTPLMADPTNGIELPPENRFFITDCHFCGKETKARPQELTSRIWA